MRHLITIAAVGSIAAGTMIFSALPAEAVTFGTSFDGLGNSLQDKFNSLTVSGPNIDTINEQTNYQTFTNTASSGSVATFMFEIAKYAPSNKFGIYNSKGDKALLFDGYNDVSDGAKIDFLGNGDIAVTTKGYSPGNTNPTPPSYAEYKDFGNVFGFYLQREDGTVFYTQNHRNQNKSQQAVIYQGKDRTTLKIPGRQPGLFTDNEIIVAFEDLLRVNGNSDSDFNDLVVLVESVRPVPEPSTVGSLLAFSLCGIGLTRKHQRQKNSQLQ